ncbi:MAG: hypothetical protein ACQETI_14455 [Halobacteriota archaeon]
MTVPSAASDPYRVFLQCLHASDGDSFDKTDELFADEDDESLAHNPLTVIASILALTMLFYYSGSSEFRRCSCSVYYLNGDSSVSVQIAVVTTLFVYLLFIVVLDFKLRPDVLDLPTARELLP